MRPSKLMTCYRRSRYMPLKAHFDPFRRAASGLAAGLRPACVAARASQVGKQPSAMSRQNLVPQTPGQVGVTSRPVSDLA